MSWEWMKKYTMGKMLHVSLIWVQSPIPHTDPKKNCDLWTSIRRKPYVTPEFPHNNNKKR